jgi:hypothetical protein
VGTAGAAAPKADVVAGLGANGDANEDVCAVLEPNADVMGCVPNALVLPWGAPNALVVP